MFLEKMKAIKHKEIALLEQKYNNVSDWDSATSMPKGRSFRAAIESSPFAVIAEVKPASPSKGVIASNVNPVEQGLRYEKGGANVISVLTETEYFHGSPESLIKVKDAVSIPVLRKDFILHPLQVLESKFLGADAILLIVAFLNQDSCTQLSNLAHQLGMEVLVEVHEESEVEVALQVNADVIGINNRNLHTLAVDLETTAKLRPLITSPVPVIGESGILTLDDAKVMADASINGVLVGEFLMRHPEPAKAVAELKRVGEQQLSKSQ
ncbi:indole-3-glycerol phosphate synthase TrpC [Shimazuella sp. AN120528]|uniref:indole-3-glycerol phosphate synthase TrpC n=1 Tax=Shimazuella soli TaxID=1892854 RepID=UPI001F10EAFA|nr:indole-3-glycerol phosphate synthase TrpC [Shimazuella soli]MCH5585449.1 indole-3-glycerol phosphate synthase TrpC [Shimazuella soli]